MATNIILKRWIVVSVNDLGWAPHPATKLFVSEAEAHAGMSEIVADRLSGKSDLFVKQIELSEIV